MNQLLKGAVIGCGMISEFHLKGWKRIPEVDITALFSRKIEKAQKRKDEFYPNANTYNDLSKLFESEELDFIDILTPPALHVEHCLMAKEKQLHVFCQKPICDNVQAGTELVKAFQDYPKLFAIHENHRYRPWFQKILQLNQEEFFGKIHLARFLQHDPKEPPEIYKLQTNEGVLLEYGSHLVDMARALLGEPQRVYASLHHLNPRVHGESLAFVVYSYPESVAHIEVAWKAAGLPQGQVLIQGEQAEAFYEGTMTRGTSSRFRIMQENQLILDETRNPYDDYVESFYLFERECTNAMLNGTPVIQTGAENLQTLKTTFSAYQAAQTQNTSTPQ